MPSGPRVPCNPWRGRLRYKVIQKELNEEATVLEEEADIELEGIDEISYVCTRTSFAACETNTFLLQLLRDAISSLESRRQQTETALRVAVETQSALSHSHCLAYASQSCENERDQLHEQLFQQEQEVPCSPPRHVSQVMSEPCVWCSRPMRGFGA